MMSPFPTVTMSTCNEGVQTFCARKSTWSSGGGDGDGGGGGHTRDVFIRNRAPAMPVTNGHICCNSMASIPYVKFIFNLQFAGGTVLL